MSVVVFFSPSVTYFQGHQWQFYHNTTVLWRKSILQKISYILQQDYVHICQTFMFNRFRFFKCIYRFYQLRILIVVDNENLVKPHSSLFREFPFPTNARFNPPRKIPIQPSWFVGNANCCRNLLIGLNNSWHEIRGSQIWCNIK